MTKEHQLSVTKQPFGTVEDRSVELYELTNSNGLKVQLTNFGATTVGISTPDRNGVFEDVVLGYDTFEQYLQDTASMGSIVGRCANRIAGGRFTLEGKTYALAINNGENHLHGGIKGFNKVIWQPKTVQTDQAVGVEMHYWSKDGEEGYPGNLRVTVLFTLNEANEFGIRYHATTDQPTICNLTSHPYFNLNGAGKGDISSHLFQINADYFTPLNDKQIPTGQIEAVAATVFDFRQPTTIVKGINSGHPQIKIGNGYDHNFVLNKPVASDLTFAAAAFSADTGRRLEIYTTEQGIQFYTSNGFDGTMMGKQGKPHLLRGGFCLETQGFPDAINQPNFPSVVLHPEMVYSSNTVHKFTVA